jgi:isoquinoline 1-oxidoreductase alpha subunit
MAKLTVNGEAIDYRIDPTVPLLWALRDQSNLTGTKYGCDDQGCGACTVIIDGQAVKSCAVPVGDLEGAKVTTIEGLGANGLHPAQQAWLAEQATMCGFCEPGFVMAIAAAMEGGGDGAAITNICACGALPRVKRVIARALAARPVEPRHTSQLSHGSSAEAQESPES